MLLQCFISIGVGVGGVRVFKDDLLSGSYEKPWRNKGAKVNKKRLEQNWKFFNKKFIFQAMLNFWQSKDKWLTWEPDKKPTLEIDYIRVWSL